MTTPDGEFFRLPDFHEAIYNREELEKLPKLDGIMFEIVGSQERLINSSPVDVINGATSRNTMITSGRELIPSVELDYFADSGAYIAFEGQRPSEGLALKSVGINMTELLGGMGYAFKRLLDVQKNKKGGRSDVKWDSVDTVITGWSISPFLAGVTSLFGDTGDYQRMNRIERSVMQRVGDRLTAISDMMHPEDLAIFFRNVNMARQELLMAKYVDINAFSLNKPKLGYKMGSRHGEGVNDAIILGSDFIYPVLAQYPRSFWQNMGELNGGRGMLSSMPLFYKQWGKWKRLVVKDERFEQMLLEKGVE